MTDTNPIPRVFIVQQPTQLDVAKRFVPKFDISPARKFGKLVLVLGPGNIFEDQLARSVIHMRQVLSDYSVRDYLLALGDPVAIAAAAMVASEETGGFVNVLKWSRVKREYRCFPISIRVGAHREKPNSNGS